MINSDWEGSWVTADYAFDIMRRRIKDGDKLFSAISAYDDYLAYIVKKKDYQPGNTLVLIDLFLIAFGLDDSFLVNRAKDNANFIRGSLKAIELLRDHYTVNIISTSYQQYVHYTTFLAGIPEENTYCTRFPIDEYANEISDEDKVLVRRIADSILSMYPIEIDPEDEPEKNTLECIRRMNHFFWELLINTGFSRVMQEVKPVGGVRKFEAVAKALEKAGLDWGWSGIKAAKLRGTVDESIYNAFRQAFSVTAFPHAVWVTQDNLEETIKVSKRYRRSIRGSQIGALG